MKKLLVILFAAFLATGISAQPAKTVKLNAPNKQRGESTMQALEKRKSTREYAARELSLQDLSDLLWAANGMNRPADNKRTAPTAMNKQEIDVYVIKPEGAYLYDAKAHELKLVIAKDLREFAADRQAFAKEAPVILLIVADMGRVGGNSEAFGVFAAIDAGIVSQNISLFCAGCGFGTVPRGYMNKEALAKELGLGESYQLYLNHPVGYFK